MRLRELREEKGLAQGQLAQIMGVNQRTISKYELGTSEPDIATIKKFCEFFKVTIDYFLNFRVD